MARLTAAQRKAMPKSQFAVPSKAPGPGSYPIGDRKHQILAKAFATKLERQGKLAPSTANSIKAKANAKMGKTQSKK